jgi:hypothetical protein
MRFRALFIPMTAIAALLAASFSTEAHARTDRDFRHSTSLASQALYAFNTGLVLTVPQGAATGAHVRIESPANLSGQAWSLNAKGNLTPSSNPHLCLNEWTDRKGRHGLDVRRCDGSAAERFVTAAPSEHTPVFFISPRVDRTLCVTARLDVSPLMTRIITPIVGLSRCANDQGQAWSTANLRNQAGQFSLGFSYDMIVPGTGRPGGLASLGPATNSLSEEWALTPGHSGMTFSPIENTSSCLTAGTVRQQLKLSACNGSQAQSIVPILLRPTTNFTIYLLAVDGARHCISWGKALKQIRPVLVGPCPNTDNANSRGIWFTESWNTYNSQLPSISFDFADLFDEPWNYSNQFGMTARGTASGTAVALAQAWNGFTQAWTDLRPGTVSAGNPDGSISIRPANDLHLCLTVPGAKYQAGVKLQVQTCNGAADQEFAGTMPSVNGLSGPAVFSPFAESSLCIAPLSGVKAGSQIGLEGCPSPQTLAQDDTWQGFELMTNWMTPQP